MSYFSTSRGATWLTVIALTILALGLLFALAPGVAATPVAQPKIDSITLDEDDCLVEVAWSDGMQDATGYQISVNGIVTITGDLDDIVGDQSGLLAVFTADEDDSIIARLFINEDDDSVDVLTVGACPTPTATPSPSATPTTVPATATPAPATPTPPAPTPVIVVVPQIVERIVEVPVIRPPSTGGGGLRPDWSWGGSGGTTPGGGGSGGCTTSWDGC